MVRYADGYEEKYRPFHQQRSNAAGADPTR